MNAELYRPYADRLTPVALIPTATPDEAIDALEHAVLQLGSKAIVLGRAYRDVAMVAREFPDAVRYAQRARVVRHRQRLRLRPVLAALYRPAGRHRLSITPSRATAAGDRRAATSTTTSARSPRDANPLCKSLFLGGVTRRFPTLRFAFLEGGVGWAASLFSDLISHWEKRNAQSILELDPGSTDMEEVERLIREMAPASITDHMDRVLEYLHGSQWRPADLDDWRACEITSIDDFVPLFLEPFFFGCEADDRINAVAFDTRLNPFGAKLQAIFGSDIGHWDVRDMTTAVREAYELVEKDVVDPADFKDMMFTNSVKFCAGSNPDFFVGTHCEVAVAELRAPEG